MNCSSVLCSLIHYLSLISLKSTPLLLHFAISRPISKIQKVRLPNNLAVSNCLSYKFNRSAYFISLAHLLNRCYASSPYSFAVSTSHARSMLTMLGLTRPYALVLCKLPSLCPWPAWLKKSVFSMHQFERNLIDMRFIHMFLAIKFPFCPGPALLYPSVILLAITSREPETTLPEVRTHVV